MFPFTNKVGPATSCASDTKTGQTLATTTKKNVVGPSEMTVEMTPASTTLDNSNMFQIESAKASKYKSMNDEKMATNTNEDMIETFNEEQSSVEITPEGTSTKFNPSITESGNGDIRSSSIDLGNDNLPKDLGNDDLPKDLGNDNLPKEDKETAAHITLSYGKNSVRFQL
jgi:hypothetical protein